MRRLHAPLAMILAVAWAPAQGVAQELRLVSGGEGLVPSIVEVGLSSSTVLDRAARVDLDEVPLAEALELLRDRTGLSVVFSPSLLPEDVAVSCPCDQVTAGEALTMILRRTGFRHVEEGGLVLIEPAGGSPQMRTGGMEAEVRDSRATISALPKAPLRPLGAVAATVQEVTGTIRGRVTDAQSAQPLSAAQVHITGLDVGTFTSPEGTYEFLNVPAGTHDVAVDRIGYGRESRQVAVQSGETVQLDFQLTQRALALDAVVVTGTVGEQRRRAIGNVVGHIAGDLAETAPIDNLSDYLRGRSPGVVVQTGGGAPGTASVIRIRGRASLTATNQPLVYVDGVRVSSQLSTPQGGNTAQAISRIDDFTPEEIESIEVIKGPAAATLYGTEAAHGVIQITTKRGAFDRPAEWTFTTRQGVNWFHDPVRRTPTNYGIHPQTGQVYGLNMVAHEKEQGVDIFGYGHVQEYSAQVTGGSANMRYYLSGTVLDEDGILPDQWANRYNFRANVGATPRENITIDANAGVALLRARVTGRGVPVSAMRSIFLARPEALDTSRRGYYTAPPDAMMERAQLFQDANRVTSGFTINHNARDWFVHRLTVGLDVTDERNTNFTPHLTPYAAQFWTPIVARGSRTVRQESNIQTSFDYSASVMHDLSEAWASTSSAGFQVNTMRREFTSAQGQQFPAPGVEAVGGAAITSATGDVIENNTVGLYLQQQLAWEDRFFLTAAVRADDNSAFGSEFSLVTYPKVSASWVVSEEPFWGLDFVNSLRLRAAFGESGQQPDVFDAIRTYDPSTLPDGRPGVRPANPGNPELGPERVRELEVGWDASLWEDRMSLEFTFYNQMTRDAIVNADAAPSSGFYQRRFVNLGEVSNRGVEVGLQASVLDRPTFGWDVGLNLGTNRNRIESLGLDEGIQMGWTTRHEEGYPIGSMFPLHVHSTEVDAEGNVLAVYCKDGQGGRVSCNEAPFLFAGSAEPKAEGSLSTSFRLGPNLRLDVMSDFKLGQSNYTTLQWWRYANMQVAEELWVDRSNQDPNILGIAHFGASQEFDLWTGVPSGYWRLREVALSSPIPADWAQRVGASRGMVSLSARNLGMLWTEYRFYPMQDPEMRAPGLVLAGGDTDNTASVPPLHSVTLRLQLSF